MKHFLITLCSLTIVAADVSHLFSHHNHIAEDHQHEHDHHYHYNQPYHQHKGYSYEKPSIPFELPKPVITSYLPPQEYLPPVIIAATTKRPAPPPPQEYLPPVIISTTTTRHPIPSPLPIEYLPPVRTTKRPTPSQEYLPPVTTTTRRPPPPPPPQEYLPPVEIIKPSLPQQEYLPPVVVITTKRPSLPKVEYIPPAPLEKYEIPIPAYAEVLETNYLPPPPVHEDVNENLHEDGYHYDIPLKPFFY